MTIMRVSLVGPTLTDSQKEIMSNRLIDAFARVEVGREAPEVRSGFLVHFEQVARTDLWMGQRPNGRRDPIRQGGSGFRARDGRPVDK